MKFQLQSPIAANLPRSLAIGENSACYLASYLRAKQLASYHNVISRFNVITVIVLLTRLYVATPVS